MSTCCVVAMSTAVLAACASSPEGGTGIAEGGPVAYRSESSEGGNDGSLRGTLHVSNGCLVIVDELDQRWLPIFQAPRTTWDGTTLTYGGNSYADGSQITLRGGGVDVDVADYAPEGCDFDLAFGVAPP